MKLPFDAVKKRVDWYLMFPTPLECAQYLWEQGQVINVNNFEEACEWALDDLEAHASLMVWAKKRQGLSIEDEARLFRVLVQGRPHKSKARTAYRNERLRIIAGELVRSYGIPLVQSVSGGGVACAAAVLAELRAPDIPSEGRIANII